MVFVADIGAFPQLLPLVVVFEILTEGRGKDGFISVIGNDADLLRAFSYAFGVGTGNGRYEHREAVVVLDFFLLVLFLLTPLAVNFIYLMIPEEAISPLTLYSNILPYIIFIVFLENIYK
jgi:hypothetical protein